MSTIAIDVRGSSDPAQCAVGFSGFAEYVIKPEERALFHLGDSSLKQYAKKYMGCDPTDAWLSKPATNGFWEDLYDLYNWEETRVRVEPVSAQILEITTEDKTLATKTLTNESCVDDSVAASLYQEVNDSISEKWCQDKGISGRVPITYKMNIRALEAVTETTRSFACTLGAEDSKKKAKTIGSGFNVYLELQPDQAVKAALFATKGKIKACITYIVSVSGQSALHFYNPCQGHHFWGISTNELLKRSAKPTSFQIVQEAEFEFYADPHIDIFDLETMNVFAYVPRSFAGKTEEKTKCEAKGFKIISNGKEVCKERRVLRYDDDCNKVQVPVKTCCSSCSN